MTDPKESEPGGCFLAVFRIVTAFTTAAAFGLGVYVLLVTVKPQTGLVSFSFLLILPAAVSAFVAYVADPLGRRSLRAYLLVPVWILLVVILLSIFVLHEGVICILILSPLWLVSGTAGTTFTYHLRKRLRDRGRLYCAGLLLLPLAAIQTEPSIPLPADTVTVSRSIVVDAPADRIWPLLRGIPDVRPGEGRWNVSQDVIGIPRPFGATLVGSGVGAERFANWGKDVRFRERITEWQVDRRIGWHFIFDDIAGWRFTDRHLMPDSPYFRVTNGGYTLTPVGPNRTEIALDTRYWIKTPVNAYSALWGELFLGDLENNLLALVKQRAEKRAG